MGYLRNGYDPLPVPRLEECQAGNLLGAPAVDT